ncbi:hypothetical protein GJ496_005648 [Pomphorhynchus laevis]|nr:hypothetical protein GJ496_005648 [Pomphorhynchus laevis]
MTSGDEDGNNTLLQLLQQTQQVLQLMVSQNNGRISSDQPRPVPVVRPFNAEIERWKISLTESGDHQYTILDLREGERIIPEVLSATWRVELSIENEIILLLQRIVVLNSLRKTALEVLYEGHPGISTKRGIARTYCWWPSINSDIE